MSSLFFVCPQHVPPPLPSKTPPPPPPKTTRKQASIDSGIVQWTKTLTLSDQTTPWQHNKNKISSNRSPTHHHHFQKKKKKKKHTHKKNKRLFLPTHSSLPVPAWQDEYLTAARPFISTFIFFSLFFAFSLTMMQSATKEHVAQMSSHWIYRCCPPFKTLSGCCVQTDKLGPAAIFQYWRPSPHPPTCMRVH